MRMEPSLRPLMVRKLLLYKFNPCIVLLILSFLICQTKATSVNVTDSVKKIAPDSADGGQANHQVAAFNYLLFESQSKAQDVKLEELLQDSNHSHVSDAIDLHLANSVWKKMRLNALSYAQQRTSEVRPVINQLLNHANVSLSCRKSLNDVLDSLASLENWAFQSKLLDKLEKHNFRVEPELRLTSAIVYNAFGDFPATGLFEGSMTSMGSYHQCVDLEPNNLIERPQYCTFKFQPIVPKRPRYHNILAGINSLANFTTDNDVSERLDAIQFEQKTFLLPLTTTKSILTDGC